MVDGMCKTSLGIILKPMMALFGLSSQVDQIQEAIKSGDPLEISVRFVQLICMLFGLTSQCFTGETLVSTENGLVQIADINVGDYVWTENVDTGEKELKRVLQVYVNKTNTLVHVSITDGNGSETTVNTTENHPFYVDGKGWVAASQLKVGDKLHTKDGKIEIVKEVSIEKLDEPVKVYNLEVDEQHTYYISDNEVLVHNECHGVNGGEDNSASSAITDPARLLETTKNPQDHHIIPAFRGKSRKCADFIKALGIDVDLYTVTISGGKGGMHMNTIHGKGKWNQKWMEFIDNHPDATAKDIFQFAGKMMDDYGLSGLTIHPYGK